MHWPIIILAILLTALLAAFAVALVARLLALLPATAGKWVVIACMLGISWLAALIVVVAVSPGPAAKSSGWIPLLFGPEEGATTSMILVHVARGVAVIVTPILVVMGFLPIRGVPYRPRAANWRLGRLIKGWSVAAALFVLCVIAQDFELRWRLRKIDARADKIAAEMRPAPVPAADNAAKHYQRVLSLLKELTKWRDAAGNEEVQRTFEDCGIVTDKTSDYLRRVEPIIAELESAEKCDRCRFDDRYVRLDAYDVTVDALTLQHVAGILPAYSRYKLKHQDPRFAIRSMRILRKLQQHLLQDPRNSANTIFYWSERAIRDIAQDVVHQVHPTPFHELHAVLRVRPELEGFYRPMLRWRAAVAQKQVAIRYDQRIVHLFQQANADPGPALGSRTRMARIASELGFAHMRFLWARADLDAIDGLFPFLNDSSEAAWDRALDEDAQDHSHYADDQIGSEMNYGWLREAESLRKLTDLGLAAARYQQEQGKWPTELSQLAPRYIADIPVDAYGQPFHLRNIADGVLLHWEDKAMKWDTSDGRAAFWTEVLESKTLVFALGEAYQRLMEASHPCPQDQEAGEISG